MDKKSLIIIILAIALVLSLVFGGMYFSKYSKISKETPSSSVECGTMPSGYLKDACYVKLAVDTKTQSECANVASIDYKDMCYIEVSKVLLDKNICKSIADKFYNQPKCYAELQMLGIQ